MMTQGKKRILLDCDPGLDDVIALMLVLQSPELSLQAVTIVAGNRTADLCAQNALKVLEHYHRTDIPVCLGAKNPLVRILPKDDIYSGRDGMGEVFLPYGGSCASAEFAPQTIVRLAREFPQQLWVVCTGPMTNLALALQQEPALPQLLAGVLTINGSYAVARGPQRFDARIEWNVLVDPEAAKQVLESGLHIEALGVDVTGQLQNSLWEQLLAQAAPGSMPHHLLQSSGHFLQGRRLPPAGMFVDVMAVAYAIDPALARFVSGKVQVETTGTCTTGMTIFDNVGTIHNDSKIRVANQFDFAALQRMLAERLFSSECLD